MVHWLPSSSKAQYSGHLATVVLSRVIKFRNPRSRTAWQAPKLRPTRVGCCDEVVLREQAAPPRANEHIRQLGPWTASRSGQPTPGCQTGQICKEHGTSRPSTSPHARTRCTFQGQTSSRAIRERPRSSAVCWPRPVLPRPRRTLFIGAGQIFRLCYARPIPRTCGLRGCMLATPSMHYLQRRIGVPARHADRR